MPRKTPRRRRRSPSSRSRRRPRRGRFAGRLLRRALVLAVLVAAGYVAWLDVHVRGQFEGRRWSVPARIYARPLELYAGMRLDADALEQELRAAGYRRTVATNRIATYTRDGDSLRVHTRHFQFWDGEQPARTVRIRFRGGQVSGLRASDAEQALVRLDPALIGRIYPSHQEDSLIVRL